MCYVVLHIRYEASGIPASIVFFLESINEFMNISHQLSDVMMSMWKGLIQIHMYEQTHLLTHYSCRMSLHAKLKWKISPSMPFSNPQHVLDVLIKFVYRSKDPHKIIPWGELLVKSGNHACAWPLIIPPMYTKLVYCMLYVYKNRIICLNYVYKILEIK